MNDTDALRALDRMIRRAVMHKAGNSTGEA
jgi:hypothetical protein